jgi:hypothetical protein
MIRALEAGGVAWLMINVALFVSMNREDAMALSRRTIDRFRRAVGCSEICRQPTPADALIEARDDAVSCGALGLDAPGRPERDGLF